MKFYILSIFPDFFESPLNQSLLKKAKDKNIIDFEIINIRDFSKDKHKKVDDIPYSGGAGMVMQVQPIYDAIQWIKQKDKNTKVIYFTPRGKTLTQKYSKQFIKDRNYILLCGRYEGIDQRVIDLCVDFEISVGKFILNGGEIASLIFIEVLSRQLKGFLGNNESLQEESFSSKFDFKKEYPLYTRPKVFKGLKVPDVLLSGNHKDIKKWKENNLK